MKLESYDMKTIEVTIDRSKTNSPNTDKIVLKTLITELLYRNDLEVIHITSSSISLLLQLVHAVTLYDFELIVVENNEKYVANSYGIFLPKGPPIWENHFNVMIQHIEDNIYKRKLERKTNNG